MHEAPLASLGALGAWFWALSYLLLLVLLVSRSRGEGPGIALLSAVSVEALLAAFYAMTPFSASGNSEGAVVLEAARTLTWMFFLFWLTFGSHCRGLGELLRATSGVQRSIIVAAGALALLTAAANWFSPGSEASYALNLLSSVTSLVAVEQVWRNTSHANRRAMKFVCLALLAKFAFDLALFSDGWLFGHVDGAMWAARGYANGVLVALIAISAARNPHWKLDLNVSRQVVFHSTALLVTGSFLVAIALGGYYLRVFGGSWGSVAATMLGFSGALGALLVLTSETARARLRVSISKHFFSYRYDYREQWLKFTRSLSFSAPGEAADAEGEATSDGLSSSVLSALAGLVECRQGALWVRNSDGHFECEATMGRSDSLPDFMGDEPLLKFLQERNWILDTGGSDQEAKAEVPAVPSWLLADRAGGMLVPLTLDQSMVGIALLQMPRAQISLDWEIRDLLKTAARQAASYLVLRHTVSQLLQARQFEAFNRQSAFVAHDLKNLVAQLALLMRSSDRHKDNPEFQQDMLETVRNVHARMQGLLLQLHTGETPVDSPSGVCVADVVGAAVRSTVGQGPVACVHIDEGVGDVKITAHPRRLERVLGHLVQNASEAAMPAGRVLVKASCSGRQVLIEIIDDGVGMTESFIRNHLFQPFVSTKTGGMGIGAFETREYVRELGGSVEVSSTPSKGTKFSVRLPLQQANG